MTVIDKAVIINGDDFGMRWEVNEAIVRAHKQGVLTSTTIMANMPLAAEAIKLSKEMPQLGVGVHLNLSKGKPLSNDQIVKSLLNANGELFLSQRKLWARSVLRWKIRKAIYAELAAQIQWVLDNGIKATHLDSHYHIHIFPIVYSIVCSLAKRFDIKAIRWVYEPKSVVHLPWPLFTEECSRQANSYRKWAWFNRLQNSNLLKSGALLGVSHRGKIDVNFFRAAATYSPAMVTEVMTHPAVASSEYDKETGKKRQAELNALCDERTKKYFKDAKVKLAHYGHI